MCQGLQHDGLQVGRRRTRQARWRRGLFTGDPPHQFQASSKCDVDNDGTGEFGLFRELSGATPVRTAADGTFTGGTVLNPPVLSGAFRTMTNALGEVSRSGYLYKLYVPGAGGDAVDVHFQRVGAVFQLVVKRMCFERKFSRFSNGYEPGVQFRHKRRGKR